LIGAAGFAGAGFAGAPAGFATAPAGFATVPAGLAAAALGVAPGCIRPWILPASIHWPDSPLRISVAGETFAVSTNSFNFADVNGPWVLPWCWMYHWGAGVFMMDRCETVRG
jgi:hypothetical protein